MKQLLQVTEALKILVNPNDTCLMSKLILVCNCMYVLRFLSPMRKHWEKLKFWGKDKKFWSFDKNFHPSLSQIKGWHRGQAFLMTLLRNQNSPTCNLWHFFWIIKSSRIQDEANINPRHWHRAQLNYHTAHKSLNVSYLLFYWTRNQRDNRSKGWLARQVATEL